MGSGRSWDRRILITAACCSTTRSTPWSSAPRPVRSWSAIFNRTWSTPAPSTWRLGSNGRWRTSCASISGEWGNSYCESGTLGLGLGLGQRREYLETQAEAAAGLVRHAGNLTLHIARGEHRQQRVAKLLDPLAIAGLELEWVLRRQLDLAPDALHALGCARRGLRAGRVRQLQRRKYHLGLHQLVRHAVSAHAGRDHLGIRARASHTQQQLQLVGQAVTGIGRGETHVVKLIGVRLPASRLGRRALTRRVGADTVGSSRGKRHSGHHSGGAAEANNRQPCALSRHVTPRAPRSAQPGRTL